MSTPTPSLPDPLTTLNGTTVRTAEDWQTLRRPEVLELFRKHVYGRAPVDKPADLSFQVLEERSAFGGQALHKRVEISFSAPRGRHAFPLSVYMPEGGLPPKGLFLVLVNRAPEIITACEQTATEFWPVKMILEAGFATAAIHYNDIAVDSNEEAFQEGGVPALYQAPGTEREPDGWGTIGAWAWGLSRAIDFLVTEPRLSGVPIAVLGHSRGGKTALWCGAQDERVALAISNNSGCSGAALSRTTRGESVAKINELFPYWFCPNYKKYGDRVDELPVDQHLLLALMAPRKVYVASASDDAWADPQAEFQGCLEAAPVFRLFGQDGVRPDPADTEFPGIENPLHTGAIGHHVRPGKHGLKLLDWRYYLEYATRALQP